MIRTGQGAIMDDFLTRAVLAGMAVALVTGPLGCLVVWRRMAFFGTTLAHSALLGLSLGFLLDINLTIGLIATGTAVALALVLAEGHRGIATDTLLSILAHTGLAAGLIALAFVGGVRVDLMGYLFGDILAVSNTDVVVISAVAAATLVVLAVIWRQLLAVTIHAELAAVEGVPVLALRVAFMVLLAVVVAVALKVVGILLVTSLLVIPAAAARRFAPTPEAMAVIASIIGAGSVMAGIGASLAFDLPAGAAIVCAAGLVFLIVMLVPTRSALRHS
jgi:zinc transport system permease protein